MVRFSVAIAAFLLVVTGAAHAEPAPAREAVVRAYTEAANTGDLERFLNLYHPDIRKFRFPGLPTSEGVAHNRQAYAKSFAANPDLHVEIVERISLGDKVVVHDRVTGLAGGKTSDEITAYQVENGRLTNIVYIERLAQ